MVETSHPDTTEDRVIIGNGGSMETAARESSSHRGCHPLQSAGLFSKIFFLWMVRFFVDGYKKALREEDLYEVLPGDSSKILVRQLEREWDKELAKSKTSGKAPSLLWALMKSFGWNYALLGCPAFCEEVVLKVSQPLMVSRLVLYFSADGAVSRTEAYLQAAGISVSSLLMLMCHHACFFGSERVGMRVRIACSGLVFRKALRLSHLALGETTVGQLVNILSNDVNKFDLGISFLHYIWITPIQLGLIAFFMWREIGVSCFAGLAVLVLVCCLQLFMGKRFSRLRAKTALLSDSRIRIMNEVISGIRIIKIYAWEHSFGKLVSEARSKEIRKVMRASYLRALTFSLVFNAPLLAVFTSFVVYASLGNAVTSARVFSVVALFFATRLCLMIYFPYAIMNGSEGLVSVRRIRRFLLMDEQEACCFAGSAGHVRADGRHGPTDGEGSPGRSGDGGRPTVRPRGARPASDGGEAGTGGSVALVERQSVRTCYVMHNPMAFIRDDEDHSEGPRLTIATDDRSEVVVRNLWGSWTKDMSNAILKDISFQVGRGEVLGVIGPVGCGKSSLLMALLGELPTVSGSSALTGKVGYAAQQHWILAGSLRENILFGSPYLPAKYHRVLEQCALLTDIEWLPDGDQTLVGERGVTLSGGQRARVSLARSVYQDADVYFLDDTLSAVDAQVGRHLFEKCILSYLGSKARILVTHQLQFLHKVDRILVLNQGKVEDYGTYQELQERGVDFARLLKNPSETDSKDSENSEAAARKKRMSSRRTAARMSSIAPVESTEFKKQTPLVLEPEKMAEGHIEWRVYIRYLRSAAGLSLAVVWVIVFLTGQAVLAWTDIWLAEWAFEEEQHLARTNSTNAARSADDVTDFPGQARYIRVYAISCGAAVLLLSIRAFLSFFLFVTAARSLHDQMLGSIMRAPAAFFDGNPVGRILNRFTKDMGNMDEILPATFVDFLQAAVFTTCTVVVIAVFNPFCLTFTFPVLLLFVVARRYYLASSRDVKRLEGNARSPVFSHLSATLTGLSTVRAFRAQARFTRAFDAYQDGHTRAWFLFMTASRAFGVFIDLLNVLFICGVSFVSIAAAQLVGLNSATIGLSLAYAINMMVLFQWSVRQSAEVENQMTSVERVCQYVDVDPEAPLTTDLKPPPDWPSDGKITLEGASLRYAEGGPLVLRDIGCTIESREKIGIVGRTGAGKSSLMTVLMRLAEPTSGNITIDGVDIATIGLHDLRKNISYITQDPVLFSGTLRANLDPFEEHTDWDIWNALEQVELKQTLDELPDKLECALSEGGSNFSVGQRQLLCLARAILRKNKILILDEATANVDVRTDRLIQATIRQRFKHCTVLTIAHRLNTVMDSDRIMVLGAGKLLEFDKPSVLLQNKSGVFADMVRQQAARSGASARRPGENSPEAGTNRRPTRSADEDHGHPSITSEL